MKPIHSAHISHIVTVTNRALGPCAHVSTLVRLVCFFFIFFFFFKRFRERERHKNKERVAQRTELTRSLTLSSLICAARAGGSMTREEEWWTPSWGARGSRSCARAPSKREWTPDNPCAENTKNTKSSFAAAASSSFHSSPCRYAQAREGSLLYSSRDKSYKDIKTFLIQLFYTKQEHKFLSVRRFLPSSSDPKRWPGGAWMQEHGAEREGACSRWDLTRPHGYLLFINALYHHHHHH